MAGTFTEYNLNDATEKAAYDFALTQGHVTENDKTGVWGVKADAAKPPPKEPPPEEPPPEEQPPEEQPSFTQMAELPS